MRGRASDFQGMSTRNRICMLGLVFVQMAFSMAFLFGVAASISVPFDSPPLSLGHLARYIGQTSMQRLLGAPLILFVPASIVCTVCSFLARRVWSKWASSLLAAALPALFLDWSRLGVQVVALPLVAFYMPAQLLLGKADGEFWAEGWPCYTLMGWWLITWLTVIGVTVSKTKVRREAGPGLNK